MRALIDNRRCVIVVRFSTAPCSSLFRRFHFLLSALLMHHIREVQETKTEACVSYFGRQSAGETFLLWTHFNIQFVKAIFFLILFLFISAK